MKFVRFRADGMEQLGVLNADESKVVCISNFAFGKQAKTMQDIIATFTKEDAATLALWLASDSLADKKWWPTANVEILSPIARPIHDIICIGVNYAAHFEECARAMQMTPPPAAVYFSKRATHILGNGQEIDGHLDLDASLDYEAELAIIIGKAGCDIPPNQVEEHIFGYTVFNDVSARTLQKQHSQWFRGKSLDGFCVMGPVILHKSALPFPVEVDICSRVNGEVRQNSNTRMFIRDIPALVSEISTGITLEAGDIIITGTPSGVGLGFDPPKFLKSGDTIACEVQGIGVIQNKIK